MTELFLILATSITVTAYRAVPEQTDASPTVTSIGHSVHPYGAAVSQDVIKSGEICYGDVIVVDGYGLRVVNDTMNPRIKRGVDLFVETRAQEIKVGIRKNQTIQVLRSPNRACKRKEAMTMAMINAKRLKNALAEFRKEKGKEPTHDEFRILTSGGTYTRTSRDVQGKRGDGRDGEGRTSD